MRLFFACWPPCAVAKQLSHRAQQLVQAGGGRAMRAETLHLTLAYLGETRVERVEEACAVAASIHGTRCTLELDQLEFWPRNRIVFAAPRELPASLQELAESLRAALRSSGFRIESRPFAAHVTLLRNARTPKDADLHGLPGWPIASFVLVSSAPGARYQVLQTFRISAD